MNSLLFRMHPNVPMENIRTIQGFLKAWSVSSTVFIISVTFSFISFLGVYVVCSCACMLDLIEDCGQ